ncbi:MAG: DUF5012 domain-containing protein [Reichenbachiella sp.]
MNRYIYIVILAVLTIFTGCDGDKETEGVSRITYFPSFESEGEFYVEIGVGDPYTDVPVMATEDGQELEVTTSNWVGRYTGYSGATVGTVMDEYVATYTAVNGDGFPGSTTRTVAVVESGDMTTSIAGRYSTTTTRTTGESYSDVEIWISELSPNVYGISCLVGGFYGFGRAYGDGYLCAGGTITVVDLATNDFTFGQGQFPAWGNTVDIQTMTVDAATRTITINSLADFGGIWDFVMVQK